MHRDIKMANIFINLDVNIKLGDFGLAEEVKSDKIDTYAGSKNTMSPEIFLEKP